MTTYQQLFRYYLDSPTFFTDMASWFFEVYEHFGECMRTKENFQKYCKNDQCDVPRYSFESEIYSFCKTKLLNEQGYKINLSDLFLQRYFTANYCDEQLFSVIFSHWIGLQENQIQLIANPTKQNYSWDLLNYFLCNPTFEKINLSLAALSQYRYSGRYFIYADPEIVLAQYDQHCLKTEQTQECFPIL